MNAKKKNILILLCFQDNTLNFKWIHIEIHDYWAPAPQNEKKYKMISALTIKDTHTTILFFYEDRDS